MKKHQWSTRSKKSLLEENRLSQDLERCHQLVIHFSKHVGDFEMQVAYQTDQAAKGDGWADHRLSLTLSDLQNRKLQLKAYQDHEASLQTKINELQNPSPARIEEITRHQTTLAELAYRRLDIDRRADCAIFGLRRLLQERAALTSAMMEAAAGADFTFGLDGLDSVRFEELLANLPTTLAAKSQVYAESFFSTEY